MADIIKSWESSSQPSTFSKISRAMKKPKPLRERISFTIYKLKVQQGRLEQSYQRIRRLKDRQFPSFFRCITRQQDTKKLKNAHYTA